MMNEDWILLNCDIANCDKENSKLTCCQSVFVIKFTIVMSDNFFFRENGWKADRKIFNYYRAQFPIQVSLHYNNFIVALWCPKERYLAS